MFELAQTEEFSKWLKKLKDIRARDKIYARLANMQLGNFGDVKPVGEGVSESRIHYAAGYRLYFTMRGKTVIIMLAGGDKSSQTRDIQYAKKLAEQWR